MPGPTAAATSCSSPTSTPTGKLPARRCCVSRGHRRRRAVQALRRRRANSTWSPDGEVGRLQRPHRRQAPSPGRPTSTCSSCRADGDAAPRNLTAANPAWDAAPVFSRRRRHAVLPRDEAPGLRGRPLRADGAGPRHRRARARSRRGWDRSADNIVLSADGKRIYTTAAGPGAAPAVRDRHRHRQGRRASPATARIGAFDAAPATRSSFTRDSLKSPAQLFAAPRRRQRAAPGQRQQRRQARRRSRSATSSSSRSRAGTARRCTATS